MQGTVKFWNPAKGWGFLRGDDGVDRYVHVYNVRAGDRMFKDLREGERVEYDVGPGRAGQPDIALNVVRLETA
jgi:cold shock protein